MIKLKSNKLIKFVSLILILCLVFSMSACTKKETTDTDKPKINGEVKGNRIYPNLSKVELREETGKLIKCKSEEMLVDCLEAFANPNANEFDAIAILGQFRYDESYNKLRERMHTATRDWHTQIVKYVGSKCTVDIELVEKTPVDLSDPRVKDWNAVNGIDAQAYSNLKCTISTNYAVNSVKISFDIVKLDGIWYLANTGTIKKLQDAIITDIYK